ncbi:DUF1318 domain-containing protein [Candidatus Omnitrophota bacterium]
MRVDIYQHVVKDVESINDQIYGDQEKQLNFNFLMQSAFAADSSSEAQEAISRRKSRVKTIEGYFAKGYIGENKDALLQMRGDVPSGLKSEVASILKEENRDRDIIYRETAQKNKANISEIRKVFFSSDLKRARGGYYFEVYSKEKGKYIWIKK